MKLTVGMICTEVDQYFRQWYQLVKDLADHIVIVEDTDGPGSEVIKECLQTIGGPSFSFRTISRTFIPQYGFAAAKNIAIDMAPDDTDWYIPLDSDECFSPSSAEKIRPGLEGLEDDIDIVLFTRKNQTERPKRSNGTFVHVSDWISMARLGKFRDEPQIKAIRYGRSRYAGIIHEEPGGKRGSLENISLLHFCMMHGEEGETQKQRLYCYLIERCVDNPDDRVGVNSWWYTTWYTENKELVERRAREFKEHDPRFHNCNDG